MLVRYEFVFILVYHFVIIFFQQSYVSGLTNALNANCHIFRMNDGKVVASKALQTLHNPFHHLCTQPYIEDSTINQITDEMHRQGFRLICPQIMCIGFLVAVPLFHCRAKEVIEEVESVKSGLMDSSVLRALKQVQFFILCWLWMTV